MSRLIQQLLADWHGLLPPVVADVALMVAALVCGAIIGVEREKKLKPAGLRTMILIALGSTLFTLLSKVLAEGEPDQSRVAAQIVSGIGFSADHPALAFPMVSAWWRRCAAMLPESSYNPKSLKLA